MILSGSKRPMPGHAARLVAVLQWGMTSLPQSCVQALADLRVFLTTCWEWTHEVHYARSFPRKDPRPTIPSTYMCRHTSRMLLELLDGVDPGWKLAGGTMKPLDDRDPQPHWWI